MDWPWAAIWQSSLFPEKPWIDLPADEKNEILPFFSDRASVRPIKIPNVQFLTGMKVLDYWKELAAKPGSRKGVPARYPSGAGEYVVFTISYRDGLERVKKHLKNG